MTWYSIISNDITKLHDCMVYFESELEHAKQECEISGNIEQLSSKMPGIVEHRFSQLQELEAILEYLNIELRYLRSKTFRRFLEHYNRILSSRECEKFVDTEIEVIEFEKVVNEFALVRNKWLGISKSLDQKQWQITNIIKLRVAGMEDAAI